MEVKRSFLFTLFLVFIHILFAQNYDVALSNFEFEGDFEVGETIEVSGIISNHGPGSYSIPARQTIMNYYIGDEIPDDFDQLVPTFIDENEGPAIVIHRDNSFEYRYSFEVEPQYISNSDVVVIIWPRMANNPNDTFHPNGYFTKSYSSNGSSPIFPVVLSYFHAYRTGDQTLLQWEVLEEINHDYFEIERQDLHGQFVSIGRVPGRGTSQQSRTYQFTDHRAMAPQHFYRLKQVDFDGNATYSSVIEAKTVLDHLELKLLNDPMHAAPIMSIGSPTGQQLRFRVRSMSGGLISDRMYHLQPGTQQLSLGIAQLSAGLYVLQLTTANGKVYTRKFSVQ